MELKLEARVKFSRGKVKFRLISIVKQSESDRRASITTIKMPKESY